ncbi:MAG: hypothetical protein HOP19_18490 [Acidobacteria bacterium]|nr:hypothetical protein [Acidobacteriota bacterium]
MTPQTKGKAMILNTAIWQAVINEAKAKCGAHPLWLSAIDRAVVEIEKSRYWSFVEGVLTIQSLTSAKLYKVDGAHTCEATAFKKPCKHVAARRLMQLYFESLGNVAPVADEAPAVAPEIAAMRMREAERASAVLIRSYKGKREFYGSIEI